jgi:hypothetical protein
LRSAANHVAPDAAPIRIERALAHPAACVDAAPEVLGDAAMDVVMDPRARAIGAERGGWGAGAREPRGGMAAVPARAGEI